MAMQSPGDRNQKRTHTMLSPQRPTPYAMSKVTTPIASATPTPKKTRRMGGDVYGEQTSEQSSTPVSSPSGSVPSYRTEQPSTVEARGVGGVEDEGESPGLLNVLFSPVLKYFAGDVDGEQVFGDAEELAPRGEDLHSENAPARGTSDQTVAAVVACDARACEPSEAVETVSKNAAEEDKEGEKVDLEEAFNPYAFIKSLPPHHTVVPRARTHFVLPKKAASAPKITLVLDLDETLVHCSIEPLNNADLTFPVVFNDMEYTVYVRKRPNFEYFLKQVSQRFEVVIFTASQQVYAKKLLDILDPKHEYINHRLYRDSCLCVEGNYLKDLTALGRDLASTVLVDNSPHAFGYQVENGIPIESWFDDDNDEELLKLIPFLDRLTNYVDVRDVLRRQFRLHELVQHS
jgi:Dullard-like phosphatase family protein